jgi:hypothetical protein
VSTRDDGWLLDRLREAADEADPVPDLVFEAARAAFSLRRLDAELAELTRDSADERAGLIAVRGDGEVRLISFETGPVAVELQVTQRGMVRDLVAQISGADVAVAEVETPGVRHDVALADGVVTADGVPAGLLRLHVRTSDGHDLVTSWVRT